MKTCAVAIFVKTPELSPVKTRLSKSIGSERAVEFFSLACSALCSTVLSFQEQNTGVSAYWAIAESEGMLSARWSQLKRIYQGEGTLGERLAVVYEELSQHYDSVMFLGADAPQISSATLLEALELQNKECSSSLNVIGPAEDGGFYLFSSGVKIPKILWKSISYSTSSTCEELSQQLSQFSSVTMLDMQRDVDNLTDLRELKRTLIKKPAQSAAHQELINWLKSVPEL